MTQSLGLAKAIYQRCCATIGIAPEDQSSEQAQGHADGAILESLLEAYPDKVAQHVDGRRYTLDAMSYLSSPEKVRIAHESALGRKATATPTPTQRQRQMPEVILCGELMWLRYSLYAMQASYIQGLERSASPPQDEDKNAASEGKSTCITASRAALDATDNSC